MKVAIVTTDGRDLLRQYSVLEPWFGTAPQALLDGFAQCPETEVHVISCVRHPVHAPEKLASNVFYHGLHVPKMGWMRTGYQGCIRAVRKKMREIQPDIVHGQGAERDCAIDAVFSGYPNVLTIHGNMRRMAQSMSAGIFSYHWISGRLEALAIRQTAGVLCQTRYTLEQVESLARETWLVPNAVDETYYAVKRKPDQEPTVLCVAHIAPHKNQNQLIRSLDAIAAEKKFRLVFFGGVNAQHPYGKEFLEMVKARPWCAYEGVKLKDELIARMESAHLLVLPTLEDNCPMVVLEAMAAGVPVAASRIGGVPDLIDHGVTGLLFDPKDPEEIAAAVAQLLSDPAGAEAMAVAGKKRSSEQHRPVRIARRHIEIYREVLGRRKLSAG